MHSLADFYKKTWWLWLAFLIVFVILAIEVIFLFWLFIPGLIAYSVYFGMVRVSEERERLAREGQATK